MLPDIIKSKIRKIKLFFIVVFGLLVPGALIVLAVYFIRKWLQSRAEE